MLLRLGITILLVVIGYLAYQWYTRRQLATARNDDPLLTDTQDGLPTIVYFTTPNCMPCKTQQMPALDRLQNEFGERLQIVEVDATQQPDAADRWGVMSAPTTFVLNTKGYPQAVNHGVANEDKLKRQLFEAIS